MKNPLMLSAAVLGIVFLSYLAVTYDNQILSAMESVHNPVLDAVMPLVTDIATLYIGVPIILAIVYLSKNRRLLTDLVVGLVITLGLVLLLKMLIARPRPNGIIESAGYWFSVAFSSFPSDHAAIAFAMLGIIGHHLKNYKAWLYILAVLVALSRLYLGVHYPTDVLAGAFIGILVSQLAIKYKLGDRLRKTLRRI